MSWSADAGEALVHGVLTEHGHAMISYATRLLGDPAAAEDVVQEALLRAWRHPDALTNGRGSPRGWLLTVVRNLVTDRARARASRPPEVSGPAGRPPVASDHADAVATTLMLRAALDTLSEDHRGVLDQIYFQDRSLAQTAVALGIPAGTVKSRSHYALRAMRGALAGQELPV